MQSCCTTRSLAGGAGLCCGQTEKNFLSEHIISPAAFIPFTLVTRHPLLVTAAKRHLYPLVVCFIQSSGVCVHPGVLSAVKNQAGWSVEKGRGLAFVTLFSVKNPCDFYAVAYDIE
jgi:hypothetical protein